MSGTITGHTVSPMGAHLWNTTRSDYYWNGPGSRLYLVIGTGMGAHLVAIDHPVASGSYPDASEALAALRRFLRELSDGIGG